MFSPGQCTSKYKYRNNRSFCSIKDHFWKYEIVRPFLFHVNINLKKHIHQIIVFKPFNVCLICVSLPQVYHLSDYPYHIKLCYVILRIISPLNCLPILDDHEVYSNRYNLLSYVQYPYEANLSCISHNTLLSTYLGLLVIIYLAIVAPI
jgi:hypothetical protein